jgi:hypothetical protein
LITFFEDWSKAFGFDSHLKNIHKFWFSGIDNILNSNSRIDQFTVWHITYFMVQESDKYCLIYLVCSIQPDSGLQQALHFGVEHVAQTSPCSFQSYSSEEEDGEDHVGKEGREVNDITGRLNALHHNLQF